MTDRIRVASVMALGWIPYHEYLKDIPHSVYHDYGRRSRTNWLGCDLLFFSGNDYPPEDTFKHSEHFSKYLKGKNYRGALMLYDIELHCFDNGKHKVFFRSLRREEHIGYTPLRWPLPRFKRVLHYSKGKGKDNAPSIRYTDDGVIISYEVQFRIGRLGNLGIRLLTGYWAPFVWMRIDMEIKRSGLATVELSGSFIPSQLHYSLEPGDKYSRMYYHDMNNNTLDQIMTVLETESGKAEYNYFWRTNAQAWKL